MTGVQTCALPISVRRAPAGFAVHYIVPCTHCPPFIIPRGHDIVPLPQSICTLTPPPADFRPEDVDAGAETVPGDDVTTPSFKMVGTIATGVTGISFTKKNKTPPPVNPRETTAPFASGAPTPAPAEPASVVIPTGVPLMSQTILDSQRALAERETDLRRRETELAVKTTALSKERRLLEDDSLRINAEIENRESELFRREAELQSRADALIRALRDLDDLRRRIESLCGRTPVGR